MRRETIYYNLNNNMVEDMGCPVLPGIVMAVKQSTNITTFRMYSKADEIGM